jgi:hypothetical protein
MKRIAPQKKTCLIPNWSPSLPAKTIKASRGRMLAVRTHWQVESDPLVTGRVGRALQACPVLLDGRRLYSCHHADLRFLAREYTETTPRTLACYTLPKRHFKLARYRRISRHVSVSGIRTPPFILWRAGGFGRSCGSVTLLCSGTAYSLYRVEKLWGINERRKDEGATNGGSPERDKKEGWGETQDV